MCIGLHAALLCDKQTLLMPSELYRSSVSSIGGQPCVLVAIHFYWCPTLRIGRHLVLLASNLPYWFGLLYWRLIFRTGRQSALLVSNPVYAIIKIHANVLQQLRAPKNQCAR